MATKTKTQKQTTIKDVDCYVNKGGNAVFVNWDNQTYIGNYESLEKLIQGTLQTQKGHTAKSIKLGLKTDDGIDNEVSVFLTVKKDSVYFAPNDKTLLIAPKSTFEKFVNGEYNFVRMGLIS